MSEPVTAVASPNRGAQLLATMMSERSLTQAAVEAALGCAAAMVTRWLSGRQRPGTRWRVRLHVVYGIPLDSWDEPAAS